MTNLIEFVPVVGVAIARRRALRPATRLCQPRLVSAGVSPGPGREMRAVLLLYFTVACVAAVAQIVDLGGSVLIPADDSPYGRIAQVADPCGAMFRVVSNP